MLRFRTATLSDANTLSDLVNSAYRGDGSKVGWTTEAEHLDGQRTDPEMIREMINTPNAQIELAVENDELLGCVFLRRDQDVMYLGMLTVRPFLQGKGIGNKLMSHSEALAKSKGCHSIRMTIINDRPELEAYYKRRGYEYTGKTEPFPENDPRFGIPKKKLIFYEMMKKISE